MRNLISLFTLRSPNVRSRSYIIYHFLNFKILFFLTPIANDLLRYRDDQLYGLAIDLCLTAIAAPTQTQPVNVAVRSSYTLRPSQYASSRLSWPPFAAFFPLHGNAR